MRSRAAFSTLTSLRAQALAMRSPCRLGVDVERHALLDGVVVARDVLDRGVEVVALGLGEETDVAEVDAEQRHVDAARELGAAQDGAVAAEHHDEVAPLRDLLLGRRDVHARACP